MALTIVTLRLWHAHLGVPFEYSGDALPYGLAVDQVVNNGWVFTDGHLAAPFVQHFQDWPIPEVFMLFVVKAIGLFSHNWAAVVNGFYLLTFPAVALSAWWTLRKLQVSAWVASALALLYSVLPYHFARGEYHLFLAGYFAVPFGVLFAVRILNGEGLFSSRTRVLQTGVFAVLIASTDAYYAAFTVILIVVAAVGRLMVTKHWHPVVPAAAVVILIGIVLVLDTAPTTIYHFQHGANPLSAQRLPAESETYGLKISQMLLPTDGHRISALADVRAKYMTQFPLPSEGNGSAIGVIASIGFIGILISVAFCLLSSKLRTALTDNERYLSLLTLSAVLVGTIGGFSTLIALFASSQVRAWNRISVFIAFMSLAFIGLMLDRLIKRFGKNKRANFVNSLGILVAVLVLAIGMFDQTNALSIPDYKANAAAFLNDRNYFQQIEQRMPAGSEIFQLPHIDYPEAVPEVNMAAYDPLRPYLTTTKLHWSAGGIKGRIEAAWQDRLVNLAPKALLTDLVSVGFTGLYIDGDGYADGGAAIEAGMSNELNQTPFTSGAYAFYDLRAYATQVLNDPTIDHDALAKQLLFPVYPVHNESLYDLETDATGSWRWSSGPNARVTLDNSSTSTQRSHISFKLMSGTGQPATYTVTWPDHTVDTVTAGAVGEGVTHDLAVGKSGATISIKSNAAKLTVATDVRSLYFQVRDLVVTPQ